MLDMLTEYDTTNGTLSHADARPPPSMPLYQPKEEVHAVESSEEVNYMRGPYRNQGNYQARNDGYPNWSNYPPQQEQNVPPYRPPGYQESPSWVQGLQEGILQGVHSDMNNQLKNINAWLGMDSWRKNVDSQLGNLAAQILRPSETLSGQTEANPRSAHIAAIHMRSRRDLSD